MRSAGSIVSVISTYFHDHQLLNQEYKTTEGSTFEGSGVFVFSLTHKMIIITNIRFISEWASQANIWIDGNGQGYLCFHFILMLLGKAWIYYIPTAIGKEQDRLGSLALVQQPV